jgi:hypothetical protein
MDLLAKILHKQVAIVNDILESNNKLVAGLLEIVKDQNYAFLQGVDERSLHPLELTECFSTNVVTN